MVAPALLLQVSAGQTMFQQMSHSDADPVEYWFDPSIAHHIRAGQKLVTVSMPWWAGRGTHILPKILSIAVILLAAS